MMELLPLNSSSLPQQEHSPAWDFADPGFSEPSVLHLPSQPRQCPPGAVSPHRQNLTTLLQFNAKCPSVGWLCASWSVNTCCTKGMTAVIVSRTFKKLHFFSYKPCIKVLFFFFFCCGVSFSDHFLPNCKHAAPSAVHLMKPAFQQIYIPLLGFPGVQDHAGSFPSLLHSLISAHLWSHPLAGLFVPNKWSVRLQFAP